MYKFLIHTLLLLGGLCSSIPSLWGQKKAPIQQELGVHIGLGMSGEMGIESTRFSTAYMPHLSTSFQLSYHALLFEERFNLGIGLGVQTKGSRRTYNYLQMDIIGPTFSADQQQAFTLPIEVGYRLKIAPKHTLLVDALAIPFWTTTAYNVYDSGDAPISSYAYDAGMNIDFGLQMGYRIQLSKRLGGHVAFRGTISPFNSSTHDDLTNISTKYYTLHLHLGLQYRLGKLEA